MKKIFCVLLAVLMILSASVVAFAQDNIKNNQGSDCLYFDVSEIDWERYDKVYCHIYAENGDVFLNWQSKAERCHNTNNDGVFTFDLSARNIELLDGVTYYVIFSNFSGEQSHPLELTSENIGQTACFTGQYGAENSYELYFPVLEWADTTAPHDFAKGDVDCNNVVDIFDATMIQNAIANYDDFEYNVRCVADVDNDAVVTVLDATVIQRYLAKLDKIPDDVMIAEELLELYSKVSFLSKTDGKVYYNTMMLLNMSSPDALAFNNSMKKVYDSALESFDIYQIAEFHDGVHTVDYKAEINGRILSLVVDTHSPFLDNYYRINIDIYSLKEVSDAQLLNTLGMTYEGVKDKVKTAVENHYVDTYGADFTYSDGNKSAFEYTLSDENLENVKFYLSEDNKLCAMFTMYFAIQTGYNQAVTEIQL